MSEPTNISIITLADNLQISVNKLLEIKNSKLTKNKHYVGFGKNTDFTPAGMEEIELALNVPLAVPDMVSAFVVHAAKNPDWVMAKLEYKEGKVPVKIARKFRDKLIGKRILVHAITDATGETTYRHEALAG